MRLLLLLLLFAMMNENHGAVVCGRGLQRLTAQRHGVVMEGLWRRELQV
jgi:hypothetical protein